METYVLIPLLLILLAVFVVVNKRQKQRDAAPTKKDAAKANKTAKGKKTAVSSPTPAEPATTNASAENATEQKGTDSAAKDESENWDWQTPAAEQATVSVETVDHLTEYKVYKQFGYFQKAAESLSAYLGTYAQTLSLGMRNTLVLELADLCLQAKNPDHLSEVIEQYKQDLSKEDQENLIRQGLLLDNNHLALRVLAEELLGWGVQKTEDEVGLPAESEESTAAKNEAEASDSGKEAETAPTNKTENQRLLLVKGPDSYFQVHGDEQEVLLSFSKPERSYRLLKNQLPYDAAVRCLNKAIKQASKPASLIIDALTLDYQNDNLNIFAQHLWRLYYALGQYGNRVKERMLGWGYNLGRHPMFDELESKPNETKLREIGVAQGYLPLGSSAMKAKRLALVDDTHTEDRDAETPAEKVLRDVESLLTYGQLEQAMDLLEESVLKYPQESQLYIALFDLYERAEDWTRLQKVLQEIRAKIKTPPEEVVLAMSQLLQRINHGGAKK